MLTDYKQILFAPDTAALASKRKEDALQIVVFNIGTFEWGTTGPANGTTIFAASGGGFWVRKVNGAPATGGQASIQFKDEGVAAGTLGGINEINVVGDGATASASGSVLTITIPGSGAGGQTEVFAWAFDSVTTAGDPGIGKFRLNNTVSFPAMTSVYLDDVTYDIAMDVSAMMAKVKGTWLLHIQQSNDATRFVQFDITGLPVDNTGYWTIPVAWNGQNGTSGIVNGQKCTFVFVNQNEAGSGGGGTGVTDGDKGDVVVSGSGATWLLDPNLKRESTGIVLDGMGSVILASNTSYGYKVIPYNCTITGWDVVANATGSVEFDIKIGGVSIIGAGNAPELAIQQTNAAAVAGWDDINIDALDELEFVAVSATTVSRVTLTLFLTRV